MGSIVKLTQHPQPRICRQCLFFKNKNKSIPFDDEGICRRYPKTYNKDAYDSCGEFHHLPDEGYYG